MRRALEQLLAVVVATAAGWAFRRAFEPSDLLAPTLGASTTAVIVGCVARRLAPRSMAVEVVVSAVALLAFLSAVVVRGLDPGLVADGIVNGWAKILSSTLPVAARPELTMVPAVLTWVTAAFASSAAERGRSVMLPLLPAPFTFAAGLAVGVRGPGRPQEVVAPLAAAAACFIATRSRPAAAPARDRDGGTGRDGVLRAALGTAVAAVVVVVTLTAGARAPFADDRPPVDAREHREDPVETRTATNPLAQIPAQLRTDPPTTLFTVDAVKPERWRLAVLDEYDGLEWRSSATYRVAGRVLPSAERPRDSDRLHQRIRLIDLDSPWLPAADRPREVTGVSFRFDPLSGVLLRKGGVGDRVYEVDSDVSAYPRAEVLASQSAASGPEFARYLTLPPGLPAEVGDVTEAVVPSATATTDSGAAAASTATAKLLALDKYLREQVAHDPAATSGHSYGRLRTFVQERRGSAEQFPALFALVARKLGFPSRVVVGFAPGDDTLGSYQVTTADARAWVEVAFDGLGWVRIDSTPAALGQVVKPAEQEVDKTEEEAKDDITSGVVSTTPVDPPEVDAAPRRDIPIVAVVAAIAIGLPLLTILAAALRRARRRKKRRMAGSERLRVIGAWEEAVDVVARYGTEATRAMTASEIEAAGRSHLGPAVGDSLRPLRSLVNLARYGPFDEVEGTELDAWQHVTSVRSAAARAVSPVRRVVAVVDPRPGLARR